MTSSASGDISIVIADDSRSRRCDVGCGLDWSVAEVFRMAQQQVKTRFGAGAQLQYLDLSLEQGGSQNEALRRKGKEMGLPLLVINGEARLAGQFDIRILLDAVEAALEIEA